MSSFIPRYLPYFVNVVAHSNFTVMDIVGGSKLQIFKEDDIDHIVRAQGRVADVAVFRDDNVAGEELPQG